MCLTITERTHKAIAIEDIHCYKLLRIVEGELQSPFRGSPYTLDELKTAKIGEPSNHYEGNCRIEEGLHTFVDASNALRNLQLILAYCPNSFTGCIYEAVIPKGSEYYVGVFHHAYRQYKSYVSDQLIVKKKYTNDPINI